MEEPAPRMFWPREIWGKYAKSLDEFKDPANRGAAVECLNDMVRRPPPPPPPPPPRLSALHIAPTRATAARPAQSLPAQPLPAPAHPSKVTNALQHLPYCLKFMRKLENRDIFRFCAIPQIMAAGTLALCYNNGGVFEGAPALQRRAAAQAARRCASDPCCTLLLPRPAPAPR
jgi:farnesyl-diphosphate farnesyltransferase